MINNFNNSELLEILDSECSYTIEILKRRKDTGVLDPNPYYLMNYLVIPKSQLQSIEELVINYCESNSSRAYISLSKVLPSSIHSLSSRLGDLAIRNISDLEYEFNENNELSDELIFSSRIHRNPFFIHKGDTSFYEKLLELNYWELCPYILLDYDKSIDDDEWLFREKVGSFTRAIKFCNKNGLVYKMLPSNTGVHLLIPSKLTRDQIAEVMSFNTTVSLIPNALLYCPKSVQGSSWLYRYFKNSLLPIIGNLTE